MSERISLRFAIPIRFAHQAFPQMCSTHATQSGTYGYFLPLQFPPVLWHRSGFGSAGNRGLVENCCAATASVAAGGIREATHSLVYLQINSIEFAGVAQNGACRQTKRAQHTSAQQLTHHFPFSQTRKRMGLGTHLHSYEIALYMLYIRFGT